MKDLYFRVLIGFLQLKLRLKMRFYYYLLDLEDLVELKYYRAKYSSWSLCRICFPQILLIASMTSTNLG